MSSNNEEDESILEHCSDHSWTAKPKDGGSDSEIVLDMKCPMKLQEIQLDNNDGKFGTKEFSVFSSMLETGPWVNLFKGEMEAGTNQVCHNISYHFIHIFN